MGNSQELSIKDLTLKLVMLVALTTAQRGQSLHLLDTLNMVQVGDYLYVSRLIVI